MIHQTKQLTGACADCGRRYGDEYGFPDLIIEDWAWFQISPRGNGGGLLCPSCICRRLVEAGIECKSWWASGPLVTEEPLWVRNDFGRLMRAKREKHMVTLGDLAQIVGLRPSELSQIEHGKIPVPDNEGGRKLLEWSGVLEVNHD